MSDSREKRWYLPQANEGLAHTHFAYAADSKDARPFLARALEAWAPVRIFAFTIIRETEAKGHTAAQLVCSCYKTRRHL